MIGFWLAAAIMTALVVLPLVRVLLRPRAEAGNAAEFARGVYAQQVAEVERDLARGILSPDQAKAARAEIGRRLLNAAAEAEKAADGTATKPSTKLALVVTLALPVLALALYLPFGNPNLPAQRFAERTDRREVPPQVLTAVANLEKALQENPNDLGGWTLLAQTYSAMGRPDDAAKAYRHALGLSQGDPELMSALAEALTGATDGIVGEEAQRLFTAAAEADPMNARARFFLGVARQQAGDVKGALERWSALVADSPADAPWLPMLRQQIHQAAVTVGLDPMTYTPQPKPPAGGSPAPEGAPAAPGTPPAAGAPALSPEQMQAMAALSPEERQAAIGGMVEGLAARLKDNPDDAEGWMRLARAREVQGRVDEAREALRNATKADPQRLDAWLERGRLLAPDDRTAQAGDEFISVMEQVLALRPDNPQALYYLGQQAANQGDKDTARRHWRKLLETMPADAAERPELQRRLDGLEG